MSFMPELAEVEFNRKIWDCGVKQKICAVALHPGKRVFRGTDTDALRRALTGSVLIASAAHGKQMLFRFSKNGWLGLHLGMTGALRALPPGAPADAHDHLVLRQSRQALFFTDARQFGRILFHRGPAAPDWWTSLPAPVLSPKFTLTVMRGFLSRHGRAPIKAVLLLQRGFPGIGNWMADEVLWRSGLAPNRPARQLDAAETKRLFRALRQVCATSLRTVGRDDRDPPPGWLFHHRWRRGGHCPRDGSPLRHATIGGRTTCWCPSCQREPV
jgi:formamidopyrimidine-DNA glycosylase